MKLILVFCVFISVLGQVFAQNNSLGIYTNKNKPFGTTTSSSLGQTSGLNFTSPKISTDFRLSTGFSANQYDPFKFRLRDGSFLTCNDKIKELPARIGAYCQAVLSEAKIKVLGSRLVPIPDLCKEGDHISLSVKCGIAAYVDAEVISEIQADAEKLITDEKNGQTVDTDAFAQTCRTRLASAQLNLTPSPDYMMSLGNQFQLSNGFNKAIADRIESKFSADISPEETTPHPQENGFNSCADMDPVFNRLTGCDGKKYNETNDGIQELLKFSNNFVVSIVKIEENTAEQCKCFEQKWESDRGTEAGRIIQGIFGSDKKAQRKKFKEDLADELSKDAMDKALSGIYKHADAKDYFNQMYGTGLQNCPIEESMRKKARSIDGCVDKNKFSSRLSALLTKIKPKSSGDSRNPMQDIFAAAEYDVNDPKKFICPDGDGKSARAVYNIALDGTIEDTTLVALVDFYKNKPEVFKACQDHDYNCVMNIYMKHVYNTSTGGDILSLASKMDLNPLVKAFFSGPKVLEMVASVGLKEGSDKADFKEKNKELFKKVIADYHAKTCENIVDDLASAACISDENALKLVGSREIKDKVNSLMVEQSHDINNEKKKVNAIAIAVVATCDIYKGKSPEDLMSIGGDTYFNHDITSDYIADGLLEKGVVQPSQYSPKNKSFRQNFVAEACKDKDTIREPTPSEILGNNNGLGGIAEQGPIIGQSPATSGGIVGIQTMAVQRREEYRRRARTVAELAGSGSSSGDDCFKNSDGMCETGSLDEVVVYATQRGIPSAKGLAADLEKQTAINGQINNGQGNTPTNANTNVSGVGSGGIPNSTGDDIVAGINTALGVNGNGQGNINPNGQVGNTVGTSFNGNRSPSSFVGNSSTGNNTNGMMNQVPASTTPVATSLDYELMLMRKESEQKREIERLQFENKMLKQNEELMKLQSELDKVKKGYQDEIDLLRNDKKQVTEKDLKNELKDFVQDGPIDPTLGLATTDGQGNPLVKPSGNFQGNGGVTGGTTGPTNNGAPSGNVGDNFAGANIAGTAVGSNAIRSNQTVTSMDGGDTPAGSGVGTPIFSSALLTRTFETGGSTGVTQMNSNDRLTVVMDILNYIEQNPDAKNQLISADGSRFTVKVKDNATGEQKVVEIKLSELDEKSRKAVFDRILRQRVANGQAKRTFILNAITQKLNEVRSI